MSEFSNRIISGVALGVVGAGLLGMTEGCSAVDDAEARHSLVHESPSMDRCYGTPQPDEYVPYKVPTPEKPKPHADETVHSYEQRLQRVFKRAEHLRNQLHRNPYFLPPLDIKYLSGNVEGDPGTSKPVASRVSKSVVDITTKQWYGTGFLAEDTAGDEVVVTAAHVVKTASLSQLTIKTQDGQEVHPTGGCYIYEDRGHFADLSETSSEASTAVDTDVAVLTLPRRLSDHTLKLSSRPVRRGEWTMLVNDSDTTADKPNSYTGMVATVARNRLGYRVLTGLSPLTGSGALAAHEAQPGASGGPIVDPRTGQVVGMSIFESPNTVKEAAYLSKTALSQYYAVRIKGTEIGPESAILPVAAGSVSEQNLAAALNSPTLK